MAMDREEFAKLLDSSWLSFRLQLLEAFPDELQASALSSPRRSHTSANSSSLTGVPINNWEHSQIDEDVYNASMSACSLHSGLKDMEQEEALAVSQRLRARLGAITTTKLVSGKSLHDAVVALGLTRYSVEDMNEFVNTVADFINLQFLNDADAYCATETFEVEFVKHGTPVWAWPQKKESVRQSIRRISVSVHTLVDMTTRKSTYNVVPAQALMELFLSEEGGIHRQVFGPQLMTQFHAMKEILLAGDTNRLVAELTFVRINDLAAPPDPTHPLLYIEPFVGVLIVANGIMIGFQTDPLYEDWSGWTKIETTFAVILLIEIGLRMHFLRCRGYWAGDERIWNWFDIFLALSGITDVALQWVTQTDSDMFGTSLLRFCRLIRLARIVKVFRLKFMKDLRLMVKGWIAGIRTLALAFTLLFVVLYVISGFATMTIGSSQLTTDVGLQVYFDTIPAAMFTAFRCFTGECVNETGHSITSILGAEFGVSFILPFVASYMLVTMGIFNVILAVYVDITMKAAKENEAVTAEQYARESIRIARLTRELLKKFAAAHRDFRQMDQKSFDFSQVEINPVPALFTDDDVHSDIEISKDLFLLVIQDRQVQELMDELDLPPERATLFEVIDADGSGTLQITELVQGLLKIRGDISKSDTVAALLATKAVQRIVEEMKGETRTDLQSLRLDFSSQIEELHAQIDRSRFSDFNDPCSDSQAAQPKKSPLPTFPLPLLPLPIPMRPQLDIEEASVKGGDEDSDHGSQLLQLSTLS